MWILYCMAIRAPIVCECIVCSERSARMRTLSVKIVRSHIFVEFWTFEMHATDNNSNLNSGVHVMLPQWACVSVCTLFVGLFGSMRTSSCKHINIRLIERTEWLKHLYTRSTYQWKVKEVTIKPKCANQIFKTCVRRKARENSGWKRWSDVWCGARVFFLTRLWIVGLSWICVQYLHTSEAPRKRAKNCFCRPKVSNMEESE